MKILKYFLVRVETISDLEVYVNANIQEGWQPLGAPVFTGKVPCVIFQAMVMYEEVKDAPHVPPCDHVYRAYRQFADGTSSAICNKCGYRPDADETRKMPIDETVNKT